MHTCGRILVNKSLNNWENAFKLKIFISIEYHSIRYRLLFPGIFPAVLCKITPAFQYPRMIHKPKYTTSPNYLKAPIEWTTPWRLSSIDIKTKWIAVYEPRPFMVLHNFSFFVRSNIYRFARRFCLWKFCTFSRQLSHLCYEGGSSCFSCLVIWVLDSPSLLFSLCVAKNVSGFSFLLL